MEDVFGVGGFRERTDGRTEKMMPTSFTMYDTKERRRQKGTETTGCRIDVLRAEVEKV